MASLTTWWARSNALVSRKVPLRAVPIGVHRAATMTASGTGFLHFGGAEARSRPHIHENLIISV
nr:hypothetical protein [Mycobacterium pseudoshottsii]